MVTNMRIVVNSRLARQRQLGQMSGSPAAMAVQGTILAGPLRGSALWAARPKERGAKTWRSRGIAFAIIGPIR
jgi:hypothetical protein